MRRWRGIGWILLLVCVLQRAQAGPAITFYSTESPPVWSEQLPGGGIGSEILQAIAGATDLTVEIRYLPLKRYEGLKGGNRLGNPLFFVGQEFGAVVPLLVTDAVFCHYGPRYPEGLAHSTIGDLAGLSLGVERGTLDDKTPFERRGVTVEETMTLDALFRKLWAQRVDVVLVFDLMGYYHVNKLFPGESAELVCTPIPGGRTPIAIMFAENTPETQRIADSLRNGLAHTLEDGTYRRILTRYYGETRIPAQWEERLREMLRQYAEMPLMIYGN